MTLLSSAYAWGYCVSSSSANLRSGPGSKFKKTWTVGRYMPLLRIEKKGSWYKVKDLDGEEHWIYRNLVTKKFQCLAIKVPVSNLRTGPGTKYPMAEFAHADKYTPFKKLDSDEGWYQIEDPEGRRFWVHESNVWRPVSVSTYSF